jgi:hypothetical protein
MFTATQTPKACDVSTIVVNGRRQAQVTPAAGNVYYLVTAFDLCHAQPLTWGPRVRQDR